ncbi:hypothetical protein [Cupriavidus sp. D39]|uniref:hypothetical protein n=1 Tax=Cupriavidus sp. D39 TaxID=2997877 RepID=UPI00226F91BC|nr:hypothetical protein [Cupriavidus sp. D39]MCY0852894.1 hypothetical protein [Cupriavidus sp. D39]
MNAQKNLKLKRTVAACLVGLGGLTAMAAHAASDSRALDFETHAAFFSSETHQKPPLDPQVFVAAPGAPAALGPQNIKRSAGLRNALIMDAPSSPIMSASGQPLDMSLGAWLGAKGQVILTPQPDGREKVTVILSGLKPHGHYSLFENHFEQKPIGFTPLDGNGTDNDTVADAEGKAILSTVSPTTITHDNAVLVVYHSDGKTHGKMRGEIGVNAHHQLIARP